MSPSSKKALGSVDQVDADAFADPVPCYGSQEEIDHVAARFAKRMGVRAGDELEPLVGKLGGSIRYLSAGDMPEATSASIEVERVGRFTIFLPDYTSHLRDRFSIGHELGHYVLHFPLVGGPMKAARYGTGRTEWEANWFAAGLLLPTAKFEEMAKIFHNNTGTLALYFRVSHSVVKSRLARLKEGKLTKVDRRRSRGARELSTDRRSAKTESSHIL